MQRGDQQSKDLWTGDVTIKMETAKAVLVNYEGEEEWIAKSQVHDDSEAWKKGDVGSIVIPLWMAQKFGWAEE